MSSKRYINTLVGMALFAVVTLVPAALMSESYPTGTGAQECTVSSHTWLMPDPNRLSLPMAVYYSNQLRYSFCTSLIRLQPIDNRTIVMERPLVINRNGTPDNPLIIRGENTLPTDTDTDGDGIINGTGPVTIDAAAFRPRREDMPVAGADGTTPRGCLIKINGADVKLENIVVTGVPRGWNAICMDGDGDIMDKVDISTQSAGVANPDGTVTDGESDGFVFGPLAMGGTIKATSSVASLTGYGVVFGGTCEDMEGGFEDIVCVGTLSAATIEPIAVATIPPTNALGLTGLDTSTADRLQITRMRSVSRYFKNEASKITIVTKTITRGANNPSDPADRATYAMIEGWVASGSGTNPCSYTGTNVAQRIQIYTSNGFYDYVGPMSSGGGAGLDLYGYSGSTENMGYFLFYIKESLGIDQIGLVPESAGHQVGKPKYVGITDSSGECPEGINAIITGGSCTTDADCTTGFRCVSGTCTSSGGGGTPTGDVQRFRSKQECDDLMHSGTGGIARPRMNYDSDGDGLYDDQEDLDKDCDCDTDTETCWDDPDSDDDGIIDNRGHEIVCRDPADDWKVLPCSDSTATLKAQADPDGDGYASAIDKDSDGDGRPDYQEDRNKYYDEFLVSLSEVASHGVLYTYGRGSRDKHPMLQDGKVIDCELGTSKDVGIRYDWYKVWYEADGETLKEGLPPSRIGDRLPEGAPEIGIVRELLACRQQALYAATNFNGDFDRAPVGDHVIGMETDAYYNVDSDADGFCDGAGETGNNRCDTMPDNNGKDQCPTVTNTVDGCGGEVPCNTAALLYGVQPAYVHYNSERVPDYLKKTADGYWAALVKTDNDDAILTAPIDDATGLPDWTPGNALLDSHGNPQWRSYIDISQICFGDMDGDGIPNCVEAPNSADTCGRDITTYLDPAKADTDVDGFVDGYLVGDKKEDVCPFDRGTADDYAEGRTSWSCGDGRLIYNRLPIISCFFDRDGDNLRDCIEDKNMDGKVDVTQGLAGLDMTATPYVVLTESDPLRMHSDTDGIDDFKEVSGWTIVTNPADADTDDDHVDDNLEDRDDVPGITFAINNDGMEGCPYAMTRDTNPTDPDSDHDGLSDLQETTGDLIVSDRFRDLIQQQDFWTSTNTDLRSDPTIADSDGDGKNDGQEMPGGNLTYDGSNPCMQDSDGDSVKDNMDYCPLNKNGADEATCGGGSNAVGADSDGDGLTNVCENQLGTLWNQWDSDGDSLSDGQEAGANNPCKFEPMLGESDPMKKDTDGDGLEDNVESKLETDPNNIDSDGDCIPDGPMEITNPDGEVIQSRGEDNNRNGEWDAGSETDPNSNDTDGDGLVDGNDISGGLGEDRNCNGMRDRDEDGIWLETSPINPDSDYDGHDDREEICNGNRCDVLANMNRATSGNGGCSMVPAAGANATGMIFLIGSLLVLVRSRCLRKGEEK